MAKETTGGMYPFFVYGTLRPGQPNAVLWDGCEERMEGAVLENGRLYSLGHYPMLIEAEDGVVKGTLLTIQPAKYDLVLARFDWLEAGAYRRLLWRVLTENGRLAEAWVYVGHPSYVVNRPLIADGDWCGYIE